MQTKANARRLWERFGRHFAQRGPPIFLFENRRTGKAVEPPRTGPLPGRGASRMRADSAIASIRSKGPSAEQFSCSCADPRATHIDSRTNREEQSRYLLYEVSCRFANREVPWAEDGQFPEAQVRRCRSQHGDMPATLHLGKRNGITSSMAIWCGAHGQE